ncbi:ASCH domain-containing protein [Enterococcus sp. LJL90]
MKTGTCSALNLYELKEDRIAKIGQFEIILNGEGQPLAIIQITKIEILAMNRSRFCPFRRGKRFKL